MLSPDLSSDFQRFQPIHQVWQLPLVSQILSSLENSKYFSLFLFFLFILFDPLGRQSPLFGRFFFFFQLLLYIWSSTRDKMICLYLKIPDNFLRLIIRYGFWFWHVPFFFWVKFEFLAQFPGDHLPYRIFYDLISPLHELIMWVIVSTLLLLLLQLSLLLLFTGNHVFAWKLLVLDKNGGVRGVMVIFIGDGHGDISSNAGRDWLHFT